MTPKLSICVPSRNRQYYFQHTIAALLQSPRTDVEFVFADNSDDPSIMNDYMAGIQDERAVFLPSTGATLSMVDNWERTVSATRGEWVTVIGDDDYADPEIAQLLIRVEELDPDTDGVTWRTLDYHWPVEGELACNTHVPYRDNFLILPRSLMLKRMFGWDDAGLVPTSGMSIYHSAISRRLLETIKTIYGRYFEHPTVDYDSAIKNIVHGKTFFVSARPMTVMGVCPLSNTFCVNNLEDMKKKIQQFNQDVGRDINNDPEVATFPFKTTNGLTATVGLVIHWYKTKYNFAYGGWEKNFIEACQRNVELFRDPEAFEIVKDGYQRVIDGWQGGRFRKFFNPKLKSDEILIQATGFSEEGMFIDSRAPGFETAAGFFNFICNLIPSVDSLDMRREVIGTIISSSHNAPGKAA